MQGLQRGLHSLRSMGHHPRPVLLKLRGLRTASSAAIIGSLDNNTMIITDYDVRCGVPDGYAIFSGAFCSHCTLLVSLMTLTLICVKINSFSSKCFPAAFAALALVALAALAVLAALAALAALAVLAASVALS